MSVPDYPWFGPRHGMGWGWTPVNWEGDAVIVAFLLLLGAAWVAFGRSWKFLYAVFGLTGIVLAVCVVTGTAPG